MESYILVFLLTVDFVNPVQKMQFKWTLDFKSVVREEQ